MSLSAGQQPGGGGIDQHALGQQIPAFGGFFLDHGVPTTFLTDPSQRGAVARAASAFLSSRGLGPADLQVRQARFTYRQLERFFEQARSSVFAGPGGVFADLDEANNRVTLGVENGAAAGRVRAAVAQLGLPEGAITVEVTPPILPLTTLQQSFNPVVGGVQIHFSNYLCSIGVIAESGGTLGFVTASHCTAKQGGAEGTLYYQPLSSAQPTAIAIETIDPVYFSFRQNHDCYRSAKCRYSDASFAASTDARPFALGQIARTSGTPGDLTWTNNYWTITTTAAGNGTVGDARSKVGRTTGYTTGTVAASCVDTGVSGSNIVLLCQDWVAGNGTIVGSGDSGSQVFGNVSGSDVTWWGGLWGGSSDGSTFVYSPASAIMGELGALTVTGGGGGPGPGPETLSASFTYSCRSSSCAFDASGSTGTTSATSYDWTFGDTGTGSGVTATHDYTGGGTYTVGLTVSNTPTDQATATATITCNQRGNKLQCK